MTQEREVGGLRCMEVLALLPELLDGDLDTPRQAQVEAHVQGCDWCARFGGQYAALVADLKALKPPAAAGEGR